VGSRQPVAEGVCGAAIWGTLTGGWIYWRRKPMETLSDRYRRWPVFWMIVGMVILLNIWFDYYHPLGFIFDVVVGIVLLIQYLNKSTPA
jgi:polyferredoxin